MKERSAGAESGADAERGAGVERWSAGAVARMLGVSPTTLRTWDRRYGLGPSTREEGRHRRYTNPDVARLRRMLELTAQGMAPAAAAAVALGSPTPAAGAGAEGSFGPAGSAGSPGSPGSAGVRARGGTRTPVADSAEARGFARAAARLDVPLMSSLTTSLISRYGVVAAWESVLAPFLIALGERVAARGGGVEVEHLATASIVGALRVEAVPPKGRLPVLLACAPEEQHSLPLDALAAALAERGYASRNLGARVPAGALLAAVTLLSPGTVMLWAHAESFARAAPVAELIARGQSVLVGGAGWEDHLPEGARRVRSLGEAVETVLGLNRF